MNDDPYDEPPPADEPPPEWSGLDDPAAPSRPLRAPAPLLEPLDPARVAEDLEALIAQQKDTDERLAGLEGSMGEVIELLQQMLEDTPEGPWTWAALSDGAKSDLFTKLADWVDWAITRYELVGQLTIRPCWHRHPVAVEELTAVWVAWLSVYAKSKRVPHDGLINWHDRWWWPCLRRLAELRVFSNCTSGHVDHTNTPKLTDRDDLVQMLEDLTSKPSAEPQPANT